MIVVENICKEIFLQLPKVKDSAQIEYPINFSFGGEKDLNPYLKQISGAKYPLLWLCESVDEIDEYAHVAQRKVKMFIAKKSDNVNGLNPTLWESEFDLILNPILKNVIKCFEKSGVTKIINGSYKVSRRANYTEIDVNKKSESLAIDNWNVILFEAEVEFQEKADGTPLCINTIRF